MLGSSTELGSSGGGGGVSTERLAKYPRSRLLDRSKATLFLALLVLCKVLSALSFFLLFNFLQTHHELITVAHRSPPTGVVFGVWSTNIQTLGIIQILAGILYVIIQKPFVNWNKSKISRREWMRIFRHALISSMFLFVWTYGLQLCGSFRAVLITSHYNFTLAGIVAGFFIAKSGVKLRGAVLFAFGILILLLFDDNIPNRGIQPTGRSTSSPNPDGDMEHTFISRNSVGIIMLVICLLYKMGFEATSKNLAVDLGGSKILHALSTISSGLIFLILYLTDLMSGADMIPFWSNLFTLIVITVFGFVLDYYVDSICLKRLEPNKVAKIGTTASIVAALVYSLLLATEEVPNTATLIASSLIYFGVVSLTSHEKASGGGSFVGYSSDGLPLFSFSHHFSADSYVPMWKNILRLTSSVLKQIKDDTISRKLFYYSLLTFIFTGVELLYGTITNSLGMITDGFHMLFDSIALTIGLSASMICRWKSSKIFPFVYEFEYETYGRIEVLSGFLNAFFLLVIASIIMIESLQRLYNPPEVDAQRVLPISIVGLFVNLVGIYTFRASSGMSNGYSYNVNVKGVFLHILADTMGSIGVIVSSIMVKNFGLLIADPLCSIIIATLIVTSVVPLLTETSKILLLTVPPGLEKSLQQTVLQILTTEGVKGYRNARFWTHSPNLLTGSIHVQATEDANEQQVIRQVNNLFSSIGFTHFTTQLEKDEFIARKSFSDDFEGGESFDEVIGARNILLEGHSLKGFGSDSTQNNPAKGDDVPEAVTGTGSVNITLA